MLVWGDAVFNVSRLYFPLCFSWRVEDEKLSCKWWRRCVILRPHWHFVRVNSIVRLSAVRVCTLSTLPPLCQTSTCTVRLRMLYIFSYHRGVVQLAKSPLLNADLLRLLSKERNKHIQLYYSRTQLICLQPRPTGSSNSRLTPSIPPFPARDWMFEEASCDYYQDFTN